MDKYQQVTYINYTHGIIIRLLNKTLNSYSLPVRKSSLLEPVKKFHHHGTPCNGYTISRNKNNYNMRKYCIAENIDKFRESLANR